MSKNVFLIISIIIIIIIIIIVIIDRLRLLGRASPPGSVPKHSPADGRSNFRRSLQPSCSKVDPESD